jgi:hypothetical protein
MSRPTSATLTRSTATVSDCAGGNETTRRIAMTGAGRYPGAFVFRNHSRYDVFSPRRNAEIVRLVVHAADRKDRNQASKFRLRCTSSGCVASALDVRFIALSNAALQRRGGSGNFE